MKTTDEMMKAVQDHLINLRTAREAMEGGIKDILPPLTENELFLLAYVEYLEHRIESNQRLNDINRRGQELVKKYREQAERGWK